MPDLITHTAGAYFAGKGCRITRFVVFLYLGAILPDLVSRPLHIFWPRTIWAAQALHSPVGIFLICWLIGLCFRLDQRKSVFGLLFAGSILHELMDALQKHLIGGYMWFFPFSTKSFPGGLIWPDTSVRLLPYTLLAVLAVFAISRYRKKNSRHLSRREIGKDGYKSDRSDPCLPHAGRQGGQASDRSDQGVRWGETMNDEL